MDAWPNETPAPSAQQEQAARLWHAGDHQGAARLFAEAAALSADPAPLMLWQGHALQAAGRTDEALAAYEQAAAEAPADPAPHRHRGHALRLASRPEEAGQAYALAVALEIGATATPEAEAAIQRLGAESPAPPEPPRPESPAGTPPGPADLQAARAPAASARTEAQPAQGMAHRGLVPAAAAARATTQLAPPARPRIAMLRVGGSTPRSAQPSPSAMAGGSAVPAAARGIQASRLTAFDVTDLLLHFGHRRTLTGIQRVQASILGASLAAGYEASYVSFERERAGWRAVDPEALARLLAAAAAGADTADPAWILARDAVLEPGGNALPYSFLPGSTLVNLGNSWGIPDYFRALRLAQRQAGLRYVPFLHDCVPLVMPEHCVRTLVQDYARWFSSMGVHAHAVLCNSECTRADGQRFLDALIPGLNLPMEVVRLDADPRPTAAPDAAALEGTRAPRAPEPYVLFVATIESRKDHLTVFRTWLSLLRRHGAGRIPRLVCVGARGWHAEAAMNLLEGSPELARHVVLLHDISDGGLAVLYRDCLFTLYNSHYEGWGLPVTESLAWGKVPVIPRHSALLESGEGVAVYVEPQSEPHMVAAVERLLFEPGALAAAERGVAAKGRRRSWEAVLSQIGTALEAFGQEEPPPVAERIAIPLGHRIPLRRSASPVPDLSIALSDLVRDGVGWRPLEDWGAPMAEGRARLRMPLPPGLSGLLRLHLELRGVGGGPLSFVLLADGAPAGAATIAEPPEGDFATAMPVEVAEGTRILDLEWDAADGMGLRGLMICREDDLLARLDFLEAQRMPAFHAG
ncbi:glycosyltransferase [Roseomonas sp. SSH11]|uniref:Glycosyltransferase n=1 Tax=Pararoseomonas baculiformis TaxID=2820812 RepID=A0ABS4AAL5_9PROT|nr:glycosyltransferase [Pararoseomonas baculiformis]MBP0444049.1 glycosyltransferase [Pararoseomonas baculiformis]